MSKCQLQIQDLLENQRVSPSCSNAQGTTPMHIAVKVSLGDNGAVCNMVENVLK